jgi:ribonuclease HI
MAEVATQFIGYSSAPPHTPSSTRNYQQAWGDRANTGNYSPSDVIMVSGSGPWRGVTNQQIQTTFDTHYQPLLDRAIASKAQFVVGNAQGMDQLVQNYLKERGYQLSDTGKGYSHLVPSRELNFPQHNMQINYEVKTMNDETSSSFIPQPTTKDHKSSTVASGSNEKQLVTGNCSLVTVYADGSSLGNPGNGGWAYLIEEKGKAPIEGYGSQPNTTNNRMELTAVIEGIKAVKERFPNAQITVVTDSQYVVNTMTKGWQKKANQDLWQQLDAVIGEAKPQWQWVKGHSQHPQNERCDQLAKLGASFSYQLPLTMLPQNTSSYQ